jgi:hypothetical protein
VHGDQEAAVFVLFVVVAIGIALGVVIAVDAVLRGVVSRPLR